MNKTVEKKSPKKTFIKGNNAIVEAAIAAGCRFYVGYPITPQNEIPETMSSRMPQVNGTFIQAESELISINMVFGAAVAGARAMTSSSSPGISLMQEGISYMAACELPGVIINIVRGGPGLGNIAPSQCDYFQATKPGHGDFHLLVLAPANVQELYDYTFEAFDYADKYRIPVMILADGLLGQMMENINLPTDRHPKYLDVPKPWALTGAKKRGGNKIHSLLMKQGVLEEHNYHLQKKYAEIIACEKRYELYNIGQGHEYLIVAFGSVARIAKGTINLAEDMDIGLFRPITLWPYPYEALKKVAQGVKKIFVFEMNMGQMLEDVKLAIENNKKIEFYGRPGGGVPTSEELLNFIRSKVE
jgi:2-oxoglutarate ferredoxin oxidoreductase subunit alpha